MAISLVRTTVVPDVVVPTDAPGNLSAPMSESVSESVYESVSESMSESMSKKKIMTSYYNASGVTVNIYNYEKDLSTGK